MRGPRLVQEREQSKTQPATKKNKHSQSQSPTPTLMHTHKITRTQRKDKQQWTSYTHSDSPCILFTPRSSRRYPLGATSPRTQEVVPFSPGAETGRQRGHRPDPGSPGPAPNPVPNNPHPPPERGLCTKEGSTWPKPAHQPESPQDGSVPTPQ
ncbi:hypothetical protein AMECASPLE_021659 [Ameca splendens]|uniref:Uncharacterized protein n=1 Tax=Ameca splendens TaxID=208324 RepID=A0ABV0XGM9_9TELE